LKILVMNCGSSSVKYQLFDTGANLRMAKGIVERIGLGNSVLVHRPFDRPEVRFPGDVPDHTTAIDRILNVLLSPDHGVIKDRGEVEAVGHRVVHGGERFSNSVLIDDEVLEEIRKCADLAPLHNPHNLKGIEACRQLLPSVPQVAVFDTAFHQTMPDHSYLYAIPYSLYMKYKVRRYGFHGTSHYYLSRRAAEILNRPVEELKLVTCHLGNGCSITAVDGGRSVDTSMGFTPLEGLVMGTRSGDIDPAAVFYIMSVENLSISQADSLLNKQSGLLGLSEVSSDMREVLEAAEKGIGHAEVALRVYCYRIRKYISAYAGAMGGHGRGYR